MAPSTSSSCVLHSSLMKFISHALSYTWVFFISAYGLQLVSALLVSCKEEDDEIFVGPSTPFTKYENIMSLVPLSFKKK